MSIIGIKFADGGRVFNIDTNFVCDIDTVVVVETVRGIELGKVCKSTKDEIVDEVKRVIRIATKDDFIQMEELKNRVPEVKSLTCELIAKYKLDMKLVDVNFTLDGSKVIINYVCDDRVDFRELVKDLAGRLKSRIELRQIGIRDQAKILGGIGFCGKECCCKKYLNDFDKVSIKMAKTQGLSLNPTKISGICGRLMCCLAYENETYAEISTKMPKLNSKVATKDGVGTVIYNNILKGMVTVRVEKDGEIKVGEYPLSDIEIQGKQQDMGVQRVEKTKQKATETKPQEKSEQKSQVENNSEVSMGGKPMQDRPHGNKKKFNKFKKKKQNNGIKK